jgi:hypothetical protein
LDKFAYIGGIKHKNAMSPNDKEYDKHHWTANGFDSEGNRLYREKRSYETEREALLTCFHINLNEGDTKNIHKVAAYKCPVCFKWHIGHTSAVLDSKTRRKIAEQYKKFLFLEKLNNK